MKLLTNRIKLNLPFKLSYLNSNFELGYHNPALNNPALKIKKEYRGLGSSKMMFLCIVHIFQSSL